MRIKGENGEIEAHGKMAYYFWKKNFLSQYDVSIQHNRILLTSQSFSFSNPWR